MNRIALLVIASLSLATLGSGASPETYSIPAADPTQWNATINDGQEVPLLIPSEVHGREGVLLVPVAYAEEAGTLALIDGSGVVVGSVALDVPIGSSTPTMVEIAATFPASGSLTFIDASPQTAYVTVNFPLGATFAHDCPESSNGGCR